MRSFIIFTLHQYYSGYQIKNETDGMWLLWERGEVHTGFWRGNLRETGHFEDVGVVDRNVIRVLKWVFKKWNGAWARLIWLRTRMS